MQILNNHIHNISTVVNYVHGAFTYKQLFNITAIGSTSLNMLTLAALSAKKIYPIAYVMPSTFLIGAGLCIMGAVGYGVYSYMKNKWDAANAAEQAQKHSTLSYAMRLFKNYSPNLATKLGENNSFAKFLDDCHATAPMPLKPLFKRYAEIQKLFETGNGEIEFILTDYKDWLAKEDEKPFTFFIPGIKPNNHTLIPLPKDFLSAEALHQILLALKLAIGLKIPLPIGDISTEKLTEVSTALKKATGKDFPVPDLSMPLSILQELSLPHLFHAWTKTVETPANKACKQIYQIGLLQKILHENPEWKEDPDFKSWVTSSVLYLRRRQPVIIHLDASLAKDFHKAISYLHTIENELLTGASQFKLKMDPEEYQPLQLARVSKLKKIDYPDVHPITYVENQQDNDKTLAKPAKGDFTLLSAWHQYLFKLYHEDKKSAELLESEAASFLMALPRARIVDLKNLSSQQKQTASQQLYDISALIVTLNLARGNIVLHPSRLLGLLKAYDFLLHLYEEDIYLHMLIHSKTLIEDDPYFDLGSYQSQINLVIREIESVGWSGEIPNYLRQQEEVHHSYKSPLQLLNRLINVFCKPTSFFNGDKLKCQSRDQYKNFFEKLRRELKTRALEDVSQRKVIQIGVSKTPKYSGEDYTIYSLKLTIHTGLLNDNLGSPYYYGLKTFIGNFDIRWRLSEGMVTTQINPQCDVNGACSAGYWRDQGDIRSRFNHGLNQTQEKIHQDKFIFPHTSLEVSRDLQEMASGADSRASNALYTFNKYAHLLLQADFGKDYLYVFRLCLFQADRFLREISKNTNHALKCLATLDSLLEKCEKANHPQAWSFIYKMHVDVCAILKTYPSEDRVENLAKPEADWVYERIVEECPLLKTFPEECTKERLNKHSEHTQKLQHLIETSHSLELYLSYLYGKAVLGYQENEISAIAIILLKVKPQIDQRLHQSPLEGQILFDLAHEFMQVLIEKVETEGLKVLNDLVSPGQSGEWRRLSRGVYQSGTIYLDLNDFKLIQCGQLKAQLPQEVRDDESLLALFGAETLKKIYTFTFVKTELGNAWQTHLFNDETTYSIYLSKQNSQFPLLFREYEKNKWEQWIRITEDTQKLPLDFKKGFLWLGRRGYRLEDPHGKVIYTPHFKNEALNGLQRHLDGQKSVVLDHQASSLFARLDAPDAFVVTKTRRGTLVTYIRGAVQYLWNGNRNKWDSTFYKGYYISEKSIQEWLPKTTHAAEWNKPFFATGFTSYHLLENEAGKAKLVLPYCTYTNEIKNVHGKETKHTIALVPVQSTQGLWKKQGFVIFDMDHTGVLRSNQPKDYLFLAYLMYLQGKYGKALHYLQHSQMVWSGKNHYRNEIREWILKWPDNCPNAMAFKTKFLLGEHRLFEASFPSQSNLLAFDEEMLPSLLEHATHYLSCQKDVDPLLRLSKQELEEIQWLVPRCKAPINIHPQLLTKEIQEYLKHAHNSEDTLQWSLDYYIGKLKTKKVTPNEVKPVPSYLPKPLLDISSWLIPITHNITAERSNKLTEELKAIFNEDSLADQIGLELAEDILRHAAKTEESFTLNEKSSLDSLQALLALHEVEYHQKEAKLRQAVLQMFKPLEMTPAVAIERRLKEQEAQFDQLFDKARHCFGINDFSSLIEMQVITKSAVPKLKRAIHDYQIARTDCQLIRRKKECVQNLLKVSHNALMKEECAKLLLEWRQYDCENHPFAAVLLLIEDELNVTGRFSQLDHIHKLMDHPDAYIHEAMAGGKTTFLRNLFSAIECSKGRIAGVVTYSPLMAMHHKDYANLNKRALGSTAYPLLYNRNAPHDITAIKLMILYHLKALKEGGRIDQTPQATISLSHTLSELINTLERLNKELLQELQPHINALQELLKLRKDHLSVYSDEIDKIFDPTKDFNYAIGSATILQKEFYEPALILVRLLMENPTLKEFALAIKQNQLPRLPEDIFESYLRLLAKTVSVHYKLPFVEKLLLDYLTEAHQKNPEAQAKIQAFYQNVILNHPDKATVLTVQILHSYLGVLMRNLKNKMVGNEFGRSEDGITTKPFSFSAVCQETSQRSFILSTILETCVDYFVDGVHPEGAKSYVEHVRQNAIQQIDMHKNIEETQAAKRFQEIFSLSLSQVKEKDYVIIAKKLSSSYNLFEECLCAILLKNFTYFTKKISGNAHHIPHLIGHFSGSSGSPERVKTLPNTIAKPAKLIRQEGSIGSVFYNLLKHFDDQKDILPFDATKPAVSQIAKHLAPGDTWIDNAPFLPGKKGLEIVQDISKALPKIKTFRFLDEDDDVCLYSEGHVSKGEEGINLEETVSIISHKGRQGTNWTFAAKKGLVEAGPTTDLTSFYQSLMRLRLLGKGQIAKILYDISLKQQWAKQPALQDKSMLTKLIWSFVQMEANLIKQQHFQANRKRILAIAKESIDTINLEVKDVTALAEIKELTDFTLVEQVIIDPVKCGQPVMLQPSQIALEEIIKAEMGQLQGLRDSISKLKINEESQKICLEVLTRQIDKLRDPQVIMDVRDLPDKVPSPYQVNDANTTEDLEIEMEESHEVESSQQLSLEVQSEVQIEQEFQVDVDLEKFPKHPVVELHWKNKTIEWDTWWELVVDGHLRDRAAGYIDQERFPNIMRTSNTLTDRSTSLSFAERVKHDNKLWMFTETDEEARIAPRAMIIQSKEGIVYCMLASVKDVDLHYTKALRLKRTQNDWQPIPYEEISNLEKKRWGNKGVMERWNNIIKDQRDNSRDKYGYERRVKDYERIQNFDFFMLDLHETNYEESWIPTVALAKFIYMNGVFNTKEEAFLIDWLHNTWKEPLDILEKRLVHYLRQFYPQTGNNQLLNIIRKARE